MEPDSTTEIEGYDFGKQKSVDSDLFREPVDPRTSDPFGESQPQGDGSIPDEHFKKPSETDILPEQMPEPQSNFFRAPTILENLPEPNAADTEARAVSNPFEEKLFQPPRIENLTTMKQENGPPPLSR